MGKYISVNTSVWSHEMRGMHGMKTVYKLSSVFQVIKHTPFYACPWWNTTFFSYLTFSTSLWLV